MSRTAQTTRPAAGRPTREQAEQRHNELLDRSLELFLEKGFELATIDAIATSVGMTKRTVYGLYADKSALFTASVQRAVEQWIVDGETLATLETADLEETLIAVARIRMERAVSPIGLRLQRIINAESYRFPEIFKLAYEQGSRFTTDFLVDLFRRHTEAGDIYVEKPDIAASAFISMVIGPPARALAHSNGTVDEAALEERIQFCVKLFLDGARQRA